MPKGKGKRHTPEQIVAILRRSESGETVATVCRETNISAATFHRWKSQYGGMDLSELQQLRGLRDENARVKPRSRPWVCLCDLCGLCGYQDAQNWRDDLRA